MTRRLALSFLALPVAASTAVAQINVTRGRPGTAGLEVVRANQPRAVIGVTTSSSASPRDTLGILVVSVLRGGPAEKAGIEEGNRIASINGVSLRLASGDLGDREMEDVMSRRLTRELDKLNPGSEVDLRVYGNGQTRAVKVQTADPKVLYAESDIRPVRRPTSDRASLGITFASNGSRRDTLGVFVMAVDEAGPAAKAGVEEGNRIAAINGVDLRVPREDAGDAMLSSARVRRFQRELDTVRPGDQVELRIAAGGQVRTVRVSAVRASELSSPPRSAIIYNDGSFSTTIRPSASFTFDGQAFGESIRRVIERTLDGADHGLETFRYRLEDLDRGGRIRWMR
jgi:serine protease Do